MLLLRWPSADVYCSGCMRRQGLRTRAVPTCRTAKLWYIPSWPLYYGEGALVLHDTPFLMVIDGRRQLAAWSNSGGWDSLFVSFSQILPFASSSLSNWRMLPGGMSSEIQLSPQSNPFWTLPSILWRISKVIMLKKNQSYPMLILRLENFDLPSQTLNQPVRFFRLEDSFLK